MRITYLRGVATLRLDQEKCTGCGICVEVCPHSVLSMDDNKARIVSIDLCMECGACAMNCPFDAISVNSGVGCAKAVISGKVGKREAACCGPARPGH